MSEAIFVRDAFKQYGLPVHPLWSGPTWSRSANQPAFLHRGRILGKDFDKSIAPVVALDNVSFNVDLGEIFGILGYEASGKSTLIRILSAQVKPDSGQVRIFDFDVVRQAEHIKKLINPISSGASFFPRLSTIENLVYTARRDNESIAQFQFRAEEILGQLGVPTEFWTQPLENAPRNVVQLVSIARALLSRSKLLLLDEPTSGLDIQSKQAVHHLLRELRDVWETPILITTRDRNEAEQLCDRFAILRTGKIDEIRINLN